MTPCQECQKKVEFSIAVEAASSSFLINLFQHRLLMSELPWLCRLVKHNVAAKHGSSKPLTSNKLWLLELRIKSIRILASIPDALWDMCKWSIKNVEQRTCDFQTELLDVPESLHDGYALTYTHTILPHPLVSFLYGPV